MTDLMSKQLHEVLVQQFRSYATNVSTAIEQVKERHLDKEAIRDMLKHIETRSTSYTEKIAGLRDRIEAAYGTEN